jgi:hypothetical protein
MSKRLEFSIEYIYETVEGVDVALEDREYPDPAYISKKTVECRTAQRKMQELKLMITREMNRVQKALTSANSQYEILRDSKLSNDSEVKSKSSIDDRLALINSDLVDLKRDAAELKSELAVVKNLNTLVNDYSKNLTATSQDLKQQKSVMDIQIKELGLGGRTDAQTKELNDEFSALEQMEEDLLSVDTVDESEGTEESLEVADEDIEVVYEDEVESVEESTEEESPEEGEETEEGYEVEEDLNISLDDMDEEVVDAEGVDAEQSVEADEVEVVDEFISEEVESVEEEVIEDSLDDMLESIPVADKGTASKSDVSLDDSLAIDMDDVDDLVGEDEDGDPLAAFLSDDLEDLDEKTEAETEDTSVELEESETEEHTNPKTGIDSSLEIDLDDQVLDVSVTEPKKTESSEADNHEEVEASAPTESKKNEPKVEEDDINIDDLLDDLDV